MKKLLFGCMAVAMLAACTNDEVVPVNNEANAIKFSVKSENSTRAEDIYCNANPFDQFSVYAYVDGALYINNDNIENDGSVWENKSGLRYWPEGSVTFYGYKNGELTADASAPTFKNFTPAQDVDKQVDLMYARKTQAKDAGTVILNFRHALSQIVFKAYNSNPNLYVEIEGVSVEGVYGTGTYTFPLADTDMNIEHPSTSETDYVENGHGSWNFDDNGEKNASYSVEVWNGVVELKGSSENTVYDASDLTSYANTTSVDGEKTTHGDFSKAMLLLPQEIKNSEETTAAALKANAHFMVKCRIYNVAGEEVDKNNDVVLWGGDEISTTTGTETTKSVEAKDILIPFNPNWVEGKKYTYVFHFGEGNGGYNPDDGDPVLVPISFNVTIDEFVPVDAEEVEMKTTSEEGE